MLDSAIDKGIRNSLAEADCAVLNLIPNVCEGNRGSCQPQLSPPSWGRKGSNSRFGEEALSSSGFSSDAQGSWQ